MNFEKFKKLDQNLESSRICSWLEILSKIFKIPKIHFTFFQILNLNCKVDVVYH